MTSTTPPPRLAVHPFAVWADENAKTFNAFQNQYAEVMGPHTALNTVTKELLFTATCVVTRYGPGVRAHAELAMAAGASQQQVREAIHVTLPACGAANIAAIWDDVRDLLGPNGQ